MHAVRGVSYELRPGEVLGIVGESGSGKSVTSMAVMGLLPKTAGISGSVKFRGRELLGLPDKEMTQVRGKQIAMIFQDPMTSLNPVYKIGYQLAEAVLAHYDLTREQARKRAIELLEMVNIPQPDKRVDQYPHEFSGGMRQRVVIAIAMANDPDVIIADEPTTALDVTVQAQVLDSLRAAQRETGAAMVLITHDLGVVGGQADRVLVMYAGKPVEIGTVEDIYYNPRMPYTLGLLGSLPRLDQREQVQAHADPGFPALAGQPAAPGLPVHPALPDRRGRVPGARAGAGAGGVGRVHRVRAARASERLPLQGAGRPARSGGPVRHRPRRGRRTAACSARTTTGSGQNPGDQEGARPRLEEPTDRQATAAPASPGGPGGGDGGTEDEAP